LNLQDSKVLVTGGVGFIGSHLVEKLAKMGCRKVTAFDNFDDFYPGKNDNAKIINKELNAKIERGDIRDKDALSDVVEENDVIFHLAGQAGVRYCNEQPLEANNVNVEGTLNVLMAAKKHDIKKIVYASSSSIFGDPVYLPIDEKHPTSPNSPYGVSKLAAEQYCKVFSKVYGMNVISLRYFSVYGPRGRPDQVIYAFAEKIASDSSPVIFGDGNQTRDFTFVSDIVDATVLAMEKDVNPGEVFNIGHGSRITINDLAKKVALAMHSEVKPEYEEKSKGDFPDTEANNEKAKKLLGWNPKVGFDEGLQLFLDWFNESRQTENQPSSPFGPAMS